MLNLEPLLDFIGLSGVTVSLLLIASLYRIGYCCKYKEDHDVSFYHSKTQTNYRWEILAGNCKYVKYSKGKIQFFGWYHKNVIMLPLLG